MSVEMPVIGFEEMVIPDWAGAGISVSFKGVRMYRPWQRPGCRHEQLAQEMQTIKRAVNEALKFPSASPSSSTSKPRVSGTESRPLNLSPAHSEPEAGCAWFSVGAGAAVCPSVSLTAASSPTCLQKRGPGWVLLDFPVSCLGSDVLKTLWRGHVVP